MLLLLGCVLTVPYGFTQLILVEAFKNWLWFELNVASALYL